MTVISDSCCHLLFWKELRRRCLHTHWVQFLALVLLWSRVEFVPGCHPAENQASFFFKGTKQIINQFLVQPLVDSWKISIQWASAGRFNTYWGGGGSVYQSAFRRSYGSIFTANVCIFHRCWTCLHESWFSVANGEAKRAASQNKNEKDKQNKHTCSCGVLVYIYQLWTLEIPSPLKWTAPSDYKYLCFPPPSLSLSPFFYLRAPEYIQRWMFMHAICKFQSSDAPAPWTKKKKRETNTKNKQTHL